MKKGSKNDMGLEVRTIGGERDPVRLWQDAQLATLAALVGKYPPSPDEISDAPAGMEAYARSMVRASFVLADETFKQAGPALSKRLLAAYPFTAAAGVIADALDDASEDDSAVAA